MILGDQEAPVRVWDPLVRISHWSLASCVLLAWVSHEGPSPLHPWHEAFGYAALFIVVLRIIWGSVGPRYARFSQFVRTPRETMAYALQVAAQHEARHLGHNPLGGWMAVALLLAIAMASGTGWLYVTDRFWGVEWVGELHESLSELLLPLIALHVAGVAFTSRRHRENLVAAMLHGTKRAPQGSDVA